MDQNSAHRLKRRGLKFLHLVGLFIAMMIICMPGLWIVLSSLRPTVEIMAKPPVWIPSRTSRSTLTARCLAVQGRAAFRCGNIFATR